MNPEVVKPVNGGNGGNGGGAVSHYGEPVVRHDGGVTAKLILYAIFKRKWQVLGVVAVVVLAILVSGLVRPRIYKTTAKVMIRPGRAAVQVSAGDQREITLPVSASTEMINSELEIVRSKELMRMVIEDRIAAGDPIFGADTTLSMPERISALQQMMKAAPATESNVINIDLFVRNPEKGQAILDSITQAYLRRHAEVHGQPGVSDFFETQKAVLSERVGKAERDLTAFVEQEGLVVPEDQIRWALKESMRGEEQLTTTKAKIRGLERRVATIYRQLDKQPEKISREIERVNPTVVGLARELGDREVKRAQLLQRFHPDDRLITDLDAEITTLKQRIAADDHANSVIGTERVSANPVRQDLERRLTNTMLNLEDLKGRAGRLEVALTARAAEGTERARELRSKSIALTRLEAEVTAAREAYMLYEKKGEEARITEALDASRIVNVSILDQASTPVRPINEMNPLMLVAALVAGTGLGVGTAIGLEFLGRNFKFEEQVEEYLELPVFAVIPEMADVRELHPTAT